MKLCVVRRNAVWGWDNQFRFDGRALIDIIPTAPTATQRAALEDTEDERELVDALNYERYRSLVENLHGAKRKASFIRSLKRA